MDLPSNLNISSTNCLTNNNKDIISSTVVVEYNKKKIKKNI